MLRYLTRLRVRMDARGFPLDDQLGREVNVAYEAIHQLRMRLDYHSCGPANERSGGS